MAKEQINVLKFKATEKPFSRELLYNKESGIYRCAFCSNPLFSSETKFNSQETLSMDKFQLFEIDYFRIKHQLFYTPSILVPTEVKNIDEYQINLLRLIKQTEKLLNTLIPSMIRIYSLGSN